MIWAIEGGEKRHKPRLQANVHRRVRVHLSVSLLLSVAHGFWFVSSTTGDKVPKTNAVQLESWFNIVSRLSKCCLSHRMEGVLLRTCLSSRFLLCSSGLLTAPFVSGHVLTIQSQSSADESKENVNFSQEMQPGVYVLACIDASLQSRLYMSVCGQLDVVVLSINL